MAGDRASRRKAEKLSPHPITRHTFPLSLTVASYILQAPETCKTWVMELTWEVSPRTVCLLGVSGNAKLQGIHRYGCNRI